MRLVLTAIWEARSDYRMAASLGFEPRQRDSESLVLPLHYEAKAWEAKAKFALEKSEFQFLDPTQDRE